MCLGIVVTVLGRGPSIAAVRDLCEAGRLPPNGQIRVSVVSRATAGYRRASSFGSEADPAGLKPGDVVVRWAQRAADLHRACCSSPESGWDGGISR